MILDLDPHFDIKIRDAARNNVQDIDVAPTYKKNNTYGRRSGSVLAVGSNTGINVKTDKVQKSNSAEQEEIEETLYKRRSKLLTEAKSRRWRPFCLASRSNEPIHIFLGSPPAQQKQCSFYHCDNT